MLHVAYLEHCSRLFPRHTWLSSSLLYHTAGTVSGKQGTWESHTLCLVFMQESWFLVFCHSFNTSDVLTSGFAHVVSGVNADIRGESTVQRLHWLCKEHFQAGQGGLLQNTEALLRAEKQFGREKPEIMRWLGQPWEEGKDNIKWAKSAQLERMKSCKTWNLS